MSCLPLSHTQLWDVETGEEIHTLQNVVGVAFGVLQAEPQPRRNLVAAHAARAAR